MSILDQQLKDLQSKKLKAEFFKLIKDNVSKINSDKFINISKEVKDEVNAFLDAQIDMIEGGEIKETRELNSLFNSEEVKALKLLASRALKKPLPKDQIPITKEDVQVPNQPKPKVEMPKQDKISFALQHRNLGGKRVEVMGRGHGVCQGLDAPYVIVKLETGVTIQATPEEIRL